MDRELEDRWRRRDEPFSGATLSVYAVGPGFGLPLYRATQILLAAALRPGEGLFTLDDWHGHDGYITQACPLGKPKLDEMLSSFEAFAASCPGDDLVSRGVYPSDFRWYARWRLEEGDGPEHDGIVDFSGEAGLVELLAARLGREAPGAQVDVSPSGDYFDRRYAG